MAASAPMAQGQSQGRGQAPGPGQGRRTLEGALEVYYEDSTASTRLIHILDTGNERIPLRMNGHERRRLSSGDRVRVRGTMTAGTLALDPDGGGGSSLETLSLASRYTFGPQSTLVILINFQDLPDEPYSRSDAESVNTQVNNFYVENSYGQTSVNSTVVGWYTIAAPSDVCNYNLWALQADMAATAAGVPISSFFRRVYAFPQTSVCAWWGLGTVGGGSKFFPSRAWVNGPYALQVVAHELGHNFGVYHSRSRTCNAGGCVVIEYGDDHDVMGAAVDGHLNAFQKERLGWLGYGSSPSIQTVTTSGDYTLEPYASSNGGLPKALKMLWSSVAGVNTYIYAEARTQVGADSDLTPGVIIHTGVETDGRESYEIDLRPSSSAIDYILSPGQTITFDGAFSLRTVSSGAFGASLTVTDVLEGTATALTPAPADGTYGGMTTLSATLTADGAPLLDLSIDFTLDGIWVGSATTDANGIATLSGVSLAGFSANTHPTALGAAFSGDGTYEPSTGTTSLTVAQMSVDPVVTAGNKVYDASNWAALTSCTVSSVVGADEVACIVMAPPTFASSNVGSGMTVTATQVTLAGPAANNYVLTTTTATTTASITPRSVTPVVSVAAKSCTTRPQPLRSPVVSSPARSSATPSDAQGRRRSTPPRPA